MAKHQLGHGACLECQRESMSLLLTNNRLSTTNTGLLEALENLLKEHGTMPGYMEGEIFACDCAVCDRAHAIIGKARVKGDTSLDSEHGRPIILPSAMERATE